MEIALLVTDRTDLCFPAYDVKAEPNGPPVGTSYFLTPQRMAYTVDSEPSVCFRRMWG